MQKRQMLLSYFTFRRSIILAREVGYCDIAHAILLHLAGDCLREIMSKQPVLRNFEISHFERAKLSELVFSYFGVGSEVDPGTNLFTQSIIWNSNDMSFNDSRMSMEDVFNLAGIYILTAANQHVLDATDNLSVTVFIDGSNITSAQPTIFRDGFFRFFFVIPVFQHGRVAAGVQFSRSVDRDDFVVFVDYFDLGVISGITNCRGSNFQAIMGVRRKSNWTRFSHPVRHHNIGHVEIFGDRSNNRLETRSSGHYACTQTCYVRFFQIRMIDHIYEHGRRSVQ